MQGLKTSIYHSLFQEASGVHNPPVKKVITHKEEREGNETKNQEIQKREGF